MGDTPPLRAVVEARNFRGPRGGCKIAMVLECGHSIWRGGQTPPTQIQCIMCWRENEVGISTDPRAIAAIVLPHADWEPGERCEGRIDGSTGHCLHHGLHDLVCCWCGDLFVPTVANGSAHGRHMPESQSSEWTARSDPDRFVRG